MTTVITTNNLSGLSSQLEILNYINKLLNKWVAGDLVRVTEEGIKWLPGHELPTPTLSSLTNDPKFKLVRQHAISGGIFMLLGTPVIYIAADEMALRVKAPVLCMDAQTTLLFNIRYYDRYFFSVDSQEFANIVFNLLETVQPSATNSFYRPNQKQTR